MQFKDLVARNIKRIKKKLITVSHQIHSHPELAFNELYAVKLLTNILHKENFKIKKNLCSLPTAFMASYGSGPLNIAVFAEYDALPKIGHACGHNIIAASALGTVLALKNLSNTLGIKIHIFGTPAEEKVGGKILLLENGAFDHLHASMLVHPAPLDVLYPNLIAAMGITIKYIGKEAHAAAFPTEGINAADALTIAQTAIGLLRQQLDPNDKIHGIVTLGGEASNIIPGETEAEYLIRNPTLKGLKKLYPKVINCFKAGALATGAKLKIIQTEKTYANMIHDKKIGSYYLKNATKLGRVFHRYEGSFGGSTDMGNVSHYIPSIHPVIGINCSEATNHQVEFTKCCISPSADQALLDASTAMAWTIIDIALDKNLRKRLMK